MSRIVVDKVPAGGGFLPWLDGQLGRLSMYRLVIWVLLALVAWSAVLAATGQVSFSLAAVPASLAVLLAACWLSGLAFGAAFRVAPHHESGIITALLLYLIFWPETGSGVLASLAYAGVAATASKYLLAVRGRHVFNPAAAGAFIVAFSSDFLPFMSFNAATWWVATPAMLPVTAAGALLILYRTRRLALGAVFTAASMAVIAPRLVAAGESIPAALGQSLGSYPVLFIAGFMLSEPLTLPPRRWQQVAVAAVAAVVAFVPFAVGPVFNSPELGLLAGNLAAFAAGQRRGILLRFAGSRELTPTSRELAFTAVRPVRFRAGQYLELSLPHAGIDSRGRRRVFSVTSAPAESGRVTFGLRVSTPSSSFKRTLLALTDGEPVRATQVAGDFVLPRRPDVPLLLGAGGIGITPFLSQLRWLRDRQLHNGEQRDIVLLYLVSSPEEIAYRDELVQLGTKVLLVCPGSPDLPADWTHLGDRLTPALLNGAVPDLAARAAYISGSPHNIALLRNTLRAAGGRRPKTDAFLGY